MTQDNAPSFGSSSIADKVYVKDDAITTVTLPAATGGDTPLTYSLSPALPTGLSFDASSRQLSGTPTALKTQTTYTYTVTDDDDDTDTLTFDLTVEADTQPSLGAVSDQSYHQNSAITTLTLPAATGGNTPYTYTLEKTSGSPTLPPGLSFTASSRQLSGTPTGHQTAASYTYTVTDANGDTATAVFNITITQDNTPSFGSSTITDKVYVKDAAITTVTLPAATGGDTPLTYSLSPALPTGLSFDASSRQLSGTPTVLKTQTTYTYTVTDDDDDTDTLTFKLTVEADTQPSLGSVSDQSYHQNSAITTLTLPAATGGNTPYTYTLKKTSGTPTLPPGLSFTASSRQLSGTPTGHQAAASYTYKVTDADGDTATRTFNITITQDNTPSFGSSSITDKVYVKDAAITTVTLPQATGGDTPLTYSLSPALPTGLSFDASSRQLSGTPTALKTQTTYTYTVTDDDDDTDTLTFDLTVEADTQPSLGAVSDQSYHQNSAITTLTLPAATGGNTPYTYTLKKTSGTPTLPPGLSFTASSRQLSGTPTGHQTAASYTYKVTDADGDTATRTFNITITQDNTPSFGEGSITDKVYVKDAAITTVTLPAATGGDTPLTYSMSPDLPAGLSFDASSRQLSGTPTALKTQTTYTYTVTDDDDDTDTLTFKLTVEADTQPSLGSVSDQSYHQNSAITTLTLPAATGGNTPYTYTLKKTSGTPTLPPGLSFTASSRQLSGTPTGHQTAASYTYKVTDADGDTATRTFNITITQDNTPSFGEGSITDKVYVKDAAITTVTLPAATGGDTPLAYSLSPALPTGLSFDASSRQLSGTPTVLKTQTTYTYTVTDDDDDTDTLTLQADGGGGHPAVAGLGLRPELPPEQRHHHADPAGCDRRQHALHLHSEEDQRHADPAARPELHRVLKAAFGHADGPSDRGQLHLQGDGRRRRYRDADVQHHDHAGQHQGPHPVIALGGHGDGRLHRQLQGQAHHKAQRQCHRLRRPKVRQRTGLRSLGQDRIIAHLHHRQLEHRPDRHPAGRRGQRRRQRNRGLQAHRLRRRLQLGDG